MSWPTGDTPSTARVTVRFVLPRADWLGRSLVGACNWLQYLESWDAVGSVTPQQAADIYAEAMRTVEVQNLLVGQVVAFAADNLQYINQDPALGASQFRKCDGSSLLASVYPDLFNVIGYTFGGGSGVFNLPDLRGRVIVDAGTGSGLTPRSLGDVFGEETHTLGGNEVPIHTHGYTSAGPNATTVGPGAPQPTAVPLPAITGSAGGGLSHNNIQPSFALFYYIQVVP